MTDRYPGLWIALRLARRELRSGVIGFRIFLGCLALGVAAIASVQSVSHGIFAGLQADGRKILGGDVAIQLIYRDLENAELAYLRDSSSELSHYAELRAMARRADGEASTLVELKAVGESYPLFGAVTLMPEQVLHESLAHREGRWGAVLEAAVLERLGAKTGDPLMIGELEYVIRGVITNEPDRVGSGGNFGLGPRVMVDLASLPETGLMAAGSLIYHQYRLRLPESVAVEDFTQQLSDRYPEAGWRVRDYRNAAPRVQRMIERLTLFLTLVGLTALLVGGVGISSAVKAFLDGKLSTIATLKCLGAPNRTVFQLYLSQILIIAVVGILLGLAVGVVAPMATAGLLSEWLPFTMRIGIQPGALLLAALFGLLTTLSFSVWPLARVHDVPAGTLFRSMLGEGRGRPPAVYLWFTVGSAAALIILTIVSADDRRFAVWFVVGALVSMLAFRLAALLVMRTMAALPRPRHPGLRLAVANLHRPDASTPQVVLSVGLGLTVLVSIALTEGNLTHQVRESIPDQAPAFFFVDIQSHQASSLSRLIDSQPGAGEYTQVPYLRGRIVAVNGLPAEQALINRDHEWMIRGDRGLTYATHPPDNAEIIAGEWWPEDYSGPPLLSVHRDVTEAFGIDVGDRMTLNILGRDITAEVANVRDLEWRTMQINFAIMFSPEPLRSAPHAYIATLAADADAEHRIQGKVSQAFPNISVVRVKEALDAVNTVLTNIGVAIRAMASITLISGTLVLAGAIAAGHRRRVYDSVVLKVLGATRGDVTRAYLLEYGLLGLITALIASLVGSIASWAVMTQIMGAEWVFIPQAVIITVLLCISVTLTLGFVGIWWALGQKAAPLLRNE